MWSVVIFSSFQKSAVEGAASDYASWLMGQPVSHQNYIVHFLHKVWDVVSPSKLAFNSKIKLKL